MSPLRGHRLWTARVSDPQLVTLTKQQQTITAVARPASVRQQGERHRRPAVWLLRPRCEMELAGPSQQCYVVAPLILPVGCLGIEA
jgi:hypothetical protein